MDSTENTASVYRHYVTVRADGAVTDGWSDGPCGWRTPTESDVCINERGGYQFRLILGGEPTEENPPLREIMSGVPLYKRTGSEIVRRTEDELEADRAAARAAAEKAERERMETDPMTLLLETAADHEERICLMEMGVNEDDL